MIKRNQYLNQLIEAKQNGFPKVITGVRRCGKSYLLKHIYHDYLVSQGVEEEQIVILELDDVNNADYRNPMLLSAYIKEKAAKEDETFYVFIDEIQLVSRIINPAFTSGKIVPAKKEEENVISFVDVVLGLSRLPNVDLYVTGSNSKFLSKDVVTEFRDKATNIHLHPLSFREYYEYAGGEKYEAFYEFLRYGGMPLAVLKKKAEAKEAYLKELFAATYLRDIIEHNAFRKSGALDEICDIVSYHSGQLLNSQKIASIFESRKKEKLGKETIDAYLDAFIDTYLISEAKRIDVKGNASIGASRKYYFCDTGLRNARLDFSSPDFGQMVETFVYNELLIAGYSVKVGNFRQIEKDKEGKSVLKTYEIDFVASKGNEKIYLQVSDNIDSESTRERKLRPFDLIKTLDKKYLLINRPISPMRLQNGVILAGVVDFILGLGDQRPLQEGSL
jgi:uncharacterized protein